MSLRVNWKGFYIHNSGGYVHHEALKIAILALYRKFET